MALSLQDEEEKWQQNLQLQKDSYAILAQFKKKSVKKEQRASRFPLFFFVDFFRPTTL